MTQVRIETTVWPTEDSAKVKAAVLNIFPDARFAESQGMLSAESESLEKLREMLRNQRIRDSAGRILREARSGSTIRFSLNKEAAFVGRVNFAPPSPMGPIDVFIEGEDIDRLVGFLIGKSESEAANPPENLD